MTALRKIEAKLGTAIITCIYLLSHAFVFTEPGFRIEYGKYPVGGKSPLVQSIYAKKWPNPKNCNSNETYTKSCEILCSITYSKSAKIKLLELSVFLFFSARLTTLDRATAKVVLSVCPSLCHAPNPFCII